jgi:hypothetical protein
MDRERSNEPILPSNIIDYYDPVGVVGDKRWLCNATVEAIDHVNFSHMSIVLVNNGDGIPSTTKVKRIHLLKGDLLVDHPGIFRSLDQLMLKKVGQTKLGDVLVKNAAVIKGIIKKLIKQGIKKGG